jgi:periplasmic protein TonB
MSQTRPSDQALHYALVASLALHAAVLIGPPLLQEALVAPAVPPLQSWLVEEAVVRVPAPAAKPKTRTPAPVAKPAPVAPAPTPEPPAAAAEKPAPAFEPTLTPRSLAAAAAVSTLPDARVVGEYRERLLGAAEKLKRYPAQARENSWIGQVVVGINVAADGQPSVSLRKGSGYKVLDQQALDMFAQAALEVPVPAALRGRAFTFGVRAIYGLED